MESACLIKYLNNSGITVGYVNAGAIINGDSLGAKQLTRQYPQFSYLPRVPAHRIEYLDAAVEDIHHINIPALINGHHARKPERSELRSQLTPEKVEGTVAVKTNYVMVFCIAYINPIGIPHRIYLNRAALPAAEIDLPQIFSGAVKYLDSLISGVCNINASVRVDIHTHRVAKFSVLLSGTPDGENKFSLRTEYLNLVVGTVQNKDPAISINGHLGRLIEVSVNIHDGLDRNRPDHLAGTDRWGR